jgi:predicted nuclease of restriction endonuclease-like (RecB) superfamily
MKELMKDIDYKNWLIDLKSKIKQSQIKAAVSVNKELFDLYWDIGFMIVSKQAQTKWGDGLINKIAKDIKAEFPELKGFSRENLYYMKRLYLAYSQQIDFVEQVVQQLQNEKMADIYKMPVTFDTNGNMRVCNHSPVVIGNIFET